VHITSSNFVDVIDPGILGVEGGFNGVVPVIAEIGEAGADPLHVLLNSDDHVGQHRRTPGPCDHEEVREAG
jgi:hypothetical protein